MLLELASVGSMLEILDETLGDEVAELGDVHIGILESRWWVAGNLEEGSHRVKLRQGRIALGELNRGYAHRPDVAARVVGRVQLLLASYHLEEDVIHRLGISVAAWLLADSVSGCVYYGRVFEIECISS